MKMELTVGSETSAYINQTPGNYPKGNLLYSVHGESFKSRLNNVVYVRAVQIIRVKEIVLWQVEEENSRLVFSRNKTKTNEKTNIVGVG